MLAAVKARDRRRPHAPKTDVEMQADTVWLRSTVTRRCPMLRLLSQPCPSAEISWSVPRQWRRNRRADEQGSTDPRVVAVVRGESSNAASSWAASAAEGRWQRRYLAAAGPWVPTVGRSRWWCSGVGSRSPRLFFLFCGYLRLQQDLVHPTHCRTVGDQFTDERVCKIGHVTQATKLEHVQGRGPDQIASITCRYWAEGP